MIECKLCNKKFKAITNTHLRDKHNMSMKDYKETFDLTRVTPEGWSSKESNPFFGKSHGLDSKVKSTEYRLAASRRRKGKSPQEFLVNYTVEEYSRMLSIRLRGESNPMYGTTHSEERIRKLKIESKGEGNPNWRGGIAFLPYTDSFNSELKYLIRQREGFKCFICGVIEFKLRRDLDVHHVDYNKKNDYHFNLVALCQSCHGRTNGKRDMWAVYFDTKLHERYGNQQPSQLNGDISKLEGSETTELQTPTNNIPQERPTSHVDDDIVRLSLEMMR